MTETPSKWYKLICKNCDEDGYVTYSCNYGMLSVNIITPDGEFEILPNPNNKDRFRVKHKCPMCNGLKHHLFCEDGWKLEIVEPKIEKD